MKSNFEFNLQADSKVSELYERTVKPSQPRDNKV